MDINKIKLFLDVSGFSTFSEAAKNLRKSQPTISQQMGQLEEELGFKLFVRSRGRARLSSEGQEFRDLLADTFSDIEHAVLKIRGSLDQQYGSIPLAVLLDGSIDFDVAKFLTGFHAKYPNINLELSFGSNTSIEEKILNKEAAFGVSILFKDRDLLEQSKLMTESHLVYCSSMMPRYPLKKIIESRMIIDFDQDYMCFSPWLKKNGSQANQSALKKSQPQVVVPSHYEAAKILANGWGVAVLPEYVAQPLLASQKIRRYQQKSKPLKVCLDIAWLKGRELKRYEELFLKYSVDFFEDGYRDKFELNTQQ